MGTVQQLATKVKGGLQTAHPKLRQTVINKLALAVGAMLEAQTPNTSELANVLPVPTERQDIREQWLRRLLKNPLLQSPVILEPFARTVLEEAAHNGQTIILSLDQTDLGDRFAVLMLVVQVGDRSLPLAWQVEAGGGQYRLCWPTDPAGTGPGVVANGGRRVIAGRPVLSLRRVVCLVASVRLAVPPPAERQPDGRYRHR